MLSMETDRQEIVDSLSRYLYVWDSWGRRCFDNFFNRKYQRSGVLGESLRKVDRRLRHQLSQIEVIKIGNEVISAHPTGGGAIGLPAGFTPIP
jgi:hypothetical protein